MGKKLLQFLFGESQIDDELSSLVEEIADMDTDGADERLKVEKKPLESALSALDIDTEGLEQDPRGLSLVFSDGDAYRAAHAILTQFDNMHKLAELGWVFSTQGDVAQSNEPAEFRIRFLEITDVEPQDAEPKPTKGTAKNTKISAVIKKGQEFASTPMDHDDDMNPVEFGKKGSSDRHKGMSKEKDGEKAEGSWKDSKVKDQLSGQTTGAAPGKGDLTQSKEGAHPTGKLKESLTEGKHKSGCQCGFCKNKGNIHMRNKPHDDDDSQEPTDTGTDMKSESVEALVDQFLNGENPLQEVHPENPGTPPGITGHKSYPTMKVGSPDRKFRPAQGMVQPDSVEVNKQTKRKVKSA
jgi:hypothetical protein